MFRRSLLCLTALIVMPATPAFAGQTVAILDIAGDVQDESMRRSLVDAIAAELAREPDIHVITRNELNSLLGLEKLKDAMGCTDVSCLAEIGGAIGADRLLAGTLVRNRKPEGGQEFFGLTLQWLDPKRAEVLARSSETWEGGAEGVYQLVPSLVLKLVYGPRAAAFRGQLVITTSVAGAVVLINGQQTARTPLLAPIPLPIGKASVDVLADDYEPFHAAVIIDRDHTAGLIANLIEKPRPPIYTRWWFWTGAVAVVGGGVALALMSSGKSSSPDTTASGSISLPPLPGNINGVLP